jgi:hypothetical protein
VPAAGVVETFDVGEGSVGVPLTRCATEARYSSLPPRVAALRRSSRRIVDGARPSARAIPRMLTPAHARSRSPRAHGRTDTGQRARQDLQEACRHRDGTIGSRQPATHPRRLRPLQKTPLEVILPYSKFVLPSLSSHIDHLPGKWTRSPCMSRLLARRRWRPLSMLSPLPELRLGSRMLTAWPS